MNYKKMCRVGLAATITASMLIQPIVASATMVIDAPNTEPKVENDYIGRIIPKTVEEALKALKQAENNLQKATLELKDAQKNETMANARVEASKIALNKANKELNNAFGNIVSDYEKAVSEATSNLEKSNKALENARKDFSEKKKAYEEAIKLRKELETNLNNFNEQNPNLDDTTIKNELNGLNNDKTNKENAILEINKQIEETKKDKAKWETNLSNAKADLKTIETKISETTKEIARIENEIKDKQNQLNGLVQGNAQYDEAVKKLENARDKVTSLKKAIEINQEAYDKAKTEYETAKIKVETYDGTIADLEAKKSALTSEEGKADTQNNIIQDSNNIIQSTQGSYESAKMAYESAVENEKQLLLMLNESKGMLKEMEDSHQTIVQEYDTQISEAEMNVQNAAYDFVMSKATQYTINGQSVNAIVKWKDLMSKNITLSKYLNEQFDNEIKSQFTVENLKKCMDLVKVGNDRRATEGLAPLEVDFDLMIVSAISNAVSVQTSWNKPHEFFIAAMSDKDMKETMFGFIGTSVAENLAWGYADPFTAWWDAEKEIYNQNGGHTAETGHYKNLSNSNYTRTGFALGSGNATQQLFGNMAHSTTSYTPDEFMALINEAVKKAEQIVTNLKQEKIDMLGGLADNISSMKTDISTMTTEYEMAQKETGIQFDNFSIVKTDYENAIKAKEDAEKLLVTINSEIKKLNTEITNLEITKNSLAGEIDGIKTNIGKLKKNFADRRKDLNDANESLRIANEEVEKALTEVSNADKGAATLTEEIKILTSSLNVCNATKTSQIGNKEQIEKDIKSYEEKIGSIQKQITSFEENNLTIQGEIGELNKRIENKKTELGQIAKKIEEKERLSSELLNADTTVIGIENIINELNTSIEKLEITLADLQKIKTEKEAELEKAKLIDKNNPDTYKDFEKITSLERKIGEYEKQISESEKELSKYRNLLDEATKKYNKAKRDYAAALADYNMFKVENEQYFEKGSTGKTKEISANSKDHSPKTSDNNLLGVVALGMLASGLGLVNARRKEE